MARCFSQKAFNEAAGWTESPPLEGRTRQVRRPRQLIGEFIAPVGGEYPFNEIKCLEG